MYPYQRELNCKEGETCGSLKQNNKKKLEFLQACQTGQLDIVQKYVKKKGDPNARLMTGKGQTGLILSIANHHPAVRDYLLSIDTIDVNKGSFSGYTPLMVAISVEDMNSFYALLSRKDIHIDACTNGDSHATALLIACHPNKAGYINVPAALALIKAGANIDLPGKFNETPLIAASAAGCLLVVDALCNAGANLDPIETQWHLNACETAVRNNHPEVVQRLSQERQLRIERGQSVVQSQPEKPAHLLDHHNDNIPGTRINTQNSHG